MRRTLLLSLCLLLCPLAFAEEGTAAPEAHLAQFGQGQGPTQDGDTYHLLDPKQALKQSNAIAFDRRGQHHHESYKLRAKLHVSEGGEGGAFVLLNTLHYGPRGPAPFVRSWVEPNLKGTFAVGIDVHNPPSTEQFSPWGNYMDNPQREVSLHFDGREIVKRVAPKEFRDTVADLELDIQHVTGGAEVTLKLAGGTVYDRYFVAKYVPYPTRLAIGAATRPDSSTTFDVEALSFVAGRKAAPRRPPLHVEVFNHVLTNNQKTTYTKGVALPPASWAFGRVILTLDIHDAGADWDEWDRNGEISIIDAEGTKRGIVPFITSYRTECHWKVDVTHFRPYLSGQTTIEVAAGTTFYKNRGYMMSVSLDYYHGTPDLEPYKVVPLWHGTAKYKSAENHFQDFFTPQTVTVPEATEDARIFTATTGHSQIGEFTPSKRAIVVAPTKGDADGEKRFENTLWKTDVYLNPNRPQFGTWQYARAGWAPGDVVWPWWIDVGSLLIPGSDAEIRYEASAYAFDDPARTPSEKQINQAKHVVRSYLILYRAADGLTPAPSLLITGVSKDSNAQKAGMKPGDYLARYDGKRLDTVDDLRRAIQGAAAEHKETVKAVIFRGTERKEIELATGRMGINLGSR